MNIEERDLSHENESNRLENSEMSQNQAEDQTPEENKAEEKEELEASDTEKEVPVESTEEQKVEEKEESRAESESEKNDNKDNESSDEHEDYHGDEQDDHDEDDEIDYSDFNKEELIEEAKALYGAENPLTVSKRMQELKSVFQDIVIAEKKEGLEKFLQLEGTAEIDYKHPQDPLSKEFYKYYNTYRDRKKEHIQGREQERKNNLKRKKEILEEMREINDSDDLTAGYKRFKDLQEEFRNIGHVPPADYPNLMNSYRFQLDKFYDNQSIIYQFKDLDRHKNEETKKEIISSIQKLLKLDDIRTIARDLRKLKNEWKYTGPVPRELTEEIEAALNTAEEEVEKHIDTLKEKLETERYKNLEKKKELAEKIEAFLDFESNNPGAWSKKNKELGELIEQWRKIGFVPNKEKDAIQKRFREAVKEFNKKKNTFFKELKKGRQKNLDQKLSFIEKAKSFLEHEDPASVRNEVIKLQKEWKNIGPVQRKHSEETWKEFKKTCDAFFDRLKEERKKTEAEFVENLEKKEELIKRLQELELDSLENPLDKIKEFQTQFRQIGFVPIKKKDYIIAKFNEALEPIIEKTGMGKDQSPEIFKFRMKVEGMKDQGMSQNMRKEESKIRNEIGSIKEEVKQIETNLEFFNNSKNAEALLKGYEDKINGLKKKEDQLVEKLRLLRSVMD